MAYSSMHWSAYLPGYLLLVASLGCAPVPLDRASDPPEIVSPAPPTSDTGLSIARGQQLPITAEVDLAGRTVGLEVAQTRQQQAVGLMHRASLPDDRGMLFPFTIPRPARFWMKNVLIPLDMLFIFEGTVIEIAHEVPPCRSDPCPTYGPEDALVDHVIELRGGLATELGLQVGTPVDIRFLN